ncbi:MAG: tRNA pseudouridine(38-40) synthase TruA [Ignavibacteriae bacterium]|nr:MAG: tRNA pseudouridine(38-40) synthase TruA [Ignavibacteriota bacterium]
MPRKFKIYLEYNGANYSGWQKQSNAKSIQDTLIKAINEAFKKTKGDNHFIDLQASGRTDAGVHAIEQVVHLLCETMLAPEILKMKINDELPSDINILEIEKTDNKFHARHSAKSRQYLYVISKRRTAFEKRFVWWIKDKLDVKKMKEAAKLFEGMHDFKSFSDDDKEEKSTKCMIENITVEDTAEKIFIRIKASHFIWKMVRRIVGVLVEAGRGNMNNENIKLYLTTKSEIPAKYTAPPSGLFLEKIEY